MAENDPIESARTLAAEADAPTKRPKPKDPATADTMLDPASGSRPAKDVAFAETLDSDSASTLAHTIDESTITEEHPGRYAPGEELGRGGIGRVCIALDRHLGRQVAVKELIARGDGSQPSDQALARFLREARVTGRLEHPSIVPVYELGQRDDGTLYYTMKLVRGRSLAEALKEAKDLDARLRLISHFRDLCEAMAYAHDKGVVHRDLKPDNVMVGQFGETVVVDWGLAKVRGASDLRGEELSDQVKELKDAAQTLEGSALGTPAYMSPEQARGDVDAMDERTDVWGLGTILYEILTGRPPYAGKSAYDVLARVLVEPPPRVLDSAPNAPRELAAVADRALRRRKADRYPSAAAIAEEIAAWEDGRRVGAYDYSSLELLRRFVSRNKAASFAALAILIGALVSSLVVYRSYRDELAARRQAEERRGQAEEAESRAQAALAEALLEKAKRALDEGDAAAAAVYAAGALVRDPASGSEGSNERVVLARSRHSEASRRLEHEHDGALGSDESPLSSRGAFSPDGRRFAATIWQRGVAIYDLDARDAPTVLPIEGVRAVWAWTASDRLAVVAGAASGLYDLDGTRVGELPRDTRIVRVRETLEGDALLVGRGTGEILHRSPTGEETLLVTGLPSADRLAWVEDRVAVAARGNGRVEIWDVARGVLERDEMFPAAVQTLAFDPKGDVLAVGGQHPRIYFVSRNGDRRSVDAFGWVGSLTWREDGRLYASEGNGRIVARNPATGRVQESLHVPPGNGFRLVVGPRGRLAAVPARGPLARERVTLFRPSEDPARPLEIAAPVRSFAVGGEHLVVVSADGIRWVEDGRVTRWPLPEGAAQPVAAAVSAEGKVAVATSLGALLVGTEGTFRYLAPAWATRPQALLGLAFSPNGRRLYASAGEGRVGVHDLGDGETITYDDHEEAVLGLAVARAGGFFASAARDGMVCLRSDEGIEHTLRGHGGLASHAAFSPDGRRLATVDGIGVLRIWDTERGERVEEIRAHDQWINRVAYSEDGRWIATASDDGTVRVWDATRGTLVRIFPTETLAIGVAFRGDELLYHDSERIHRVVIDGEHGEPRELLEQAEARAGLRLEALQLVTR